MRRMAEAEIVVAMALIALAGACSTVKTESRVMVDPIEIKPIRVDVNANVNLVVELKEEARRVVDFITGEGPTSLLRWLFGASPAHAEEASSENDAEETYKAAQRSCRGRWPHVLAWADRGCLGFDNRALVARRPCGDLSDTDARRLGEIIEEENRNREEIIRLGAIVKGLDEEGIVIWRAQLAQEWRERAGRGHWIQTPVDRREFLNFKNTPLGERLAETVENLAPGAWYRVP